MSPGTVTHPPSSTDYHKMRFLREFRVLRVLDIREVDLGDGQVLRAAALWVQGERRYWYAFDVLREVQLGLTLPDMSPMER